MVMEYIEICIEKYSLDHIHVQDLRIIQELTVKHNNI